MGLDSGAVWAKRLSNGKCAIQKIPVLDFSLWPAE
jgi:hypothetical protein